MSKAKIKCSECGNKWVYRGLAKYSCFCPKCGNDCRIPDDAIEVIELYGIPYQTAGKGVA